MTENEAVRIEIIDVMGKIQISRDLNTAAFHSIQLSEVKNGAYFYEVTSNDESLHKGKIVILR